MTLIEELGQSARRFLERHPTHVDPTCNDLPKGVHRFSLVKGPGLVVELHPYGGGGKAIKAHWLPWAPKGATTMDLAPNDPDSHIFFTSEMSGCRLSVKDLGAGTVRVAHIAGNIEFKEVGKSVKTGGVGRDRAEAAIFGRGGAVRRLSYTEYGPNWAFVVGNYTSEQGWKFVAQVNRGERLEQVEFDRRLTIYA